jgi:hypothetical protein
MLRQLVASFGPFRTQPLFEEGSKRILHGPSRVRRQSGRAVAISVAAGGAGSCGDLINAVAFRAAGPAPASHCAAPTWSR